MNKTITKERELRQKMYILEAIGAFELLEKFKTNKDPMVNIAEMLLSKKMVNYLGDDLSDTIKEVMEAYSRYNVTINRAGAELEEEMLEYNKNMQDRYEDELRIEINNMHPWDFLV